MTIKYQPHKSKFHREGFDPNCPRCLSEDGIAGIISHLKVASVRTGKMLVDRPGHMMFASSKKGAQAEAVANEQKRMIGILNLFRKVAA